MNENLIVFLVLILYFSPVFYQTYLVYQETKMGNKLKLYRLKKYFKYSSLLIIITIVLTGIISHTNFLDYEKPITFADYDRITFENFRGIELFKKTLYGNERFAYIETTIDYKIEKDSISIESKFHPSRSFVYKKNLENIELLAHEKYHFKITEIYARKARCKIIEAVDTSKENIKQVLIDIKAKEANFQRKYDYDTFHSYVLGKQKEYEKQIDSTLESLSKYENPKISINDKN